MHWQSTDIYRDPSESRALTCGLTETTYRFPTGARSSSLLTIPAGASGKLAVCYWQIAVVAKTASVGVQLVVIDPTETITPIMEITAFPKPTPTPQRADRDVTAGVQAVFDATAKGVPTGPEWRTIGHRIKSDGVSAPLLYFSTLVMLWSTDP